tara:strand:+ start:5595 stop:6455 length:861 start_codon:yes stop_codon:yes gene_type:complete
MITLTFPEKVQGGVAVPVEVDADAIKMKELRLFISFLVLVETRSVIPKLIKVSGIFLKPVPNLIKSIHAWAPASSGLITTHALSGATTEVKSSLGNQINLKTGEELDYQFYTSRYSAGSFKIEGAPDGLTTNLTWGSGKISGAVSEPGNYSIQITGFRYSGYSGSSTPTFTLNLVVEESESSNVTTFFDPSEMVSLSNHWYQSSWFGTFYNLDGEQWIYHHRLGWLFLSSIVQDTFWLYDSELGWIFTSKVLYPYFFRDQTQNWLYQLEDSSTFRFWDYDSSSKIQ